MIIRKDRKGFSLIELLTVLFILSIILLVLPRLFKGTTQLTKKIEYKMNKFSSVQMAFDQMKRELQSLMVSHRGNVYCLGKSSPLYLHFVTYIADEGISGICEVVYYYNSQDNTLRRHLEVDADFVLEEQFQSQDDEIFCNNVTGFDILYYDGENWVGQWDSSMGGPNEGIAPKAVSITVVFKDNGRPKQFFNVIHLPVGE